MPNSLSTRFSTRWTIGSLSTARRQRRSRNEARPGLLRSCGFLFLVEFVAADGAQFGLPPALQMGLDLLEAVEAPERFAVDDDEWRANTPLAIATSISALSWSLIW
jgi:hypothetical protein